MSRRHTLCRQLIAQITLLVTVALCNSFAFQPCAAQEAKAKTDQAAWTLAETAQTAQNEKDFKFAASQWQKLIDDYPDSEPIRTAWYNLAKCHYNLQDFGSTVLAFEKALPLMREAKSIELPDALLLLGYSRLQVGRELAKTNPDSQEVSIQLTTATTHFETILKSFPDFANANQAAFFQGEAYNELQRFNEAKESYIKALSFEKVDYRIESMLALGILADRERDFEDSVVWYEKIRTLSAANDGNPAPFLSESNFHYGEALMRIGQSLRGADDTDGAAKKFSAAREILAAPAADESFELRDKAMYQQAVCSFLIDDFSAAAKQFQAVAAMEASELKDNAAVLAGESWLKAGDEQQGKAILNPILNSGSSFSVDAAIVLSQWLLKGERFRESYDLSEKWAEKSAGHPLERDLLMIRADASIELDNADDANRSANLYASIAAKFPKHPDASKALYYSASSNLKAGMLEQAIKQADDFVTRYPGDDFTPDMLEVKAEALLLNQQYAEAELLYRKLTEDFNSYTEKLPRWITRAGFASYLQGNFSQTIEWLEKKEALITTARQRAESLYWIGASYFQTDDYDSAKKNLEQSLSIDQQWNRTPEVMLTLCKTQLKKLDIEAAQKTAAEMAKRFESDPDQSVSIALFEIGTTAGNNNDLDLAITTYDKIIDQFPDSDSAPYALYQSGALRMKQKDGVDAEKRFAMFLEKFAKHPLAQDVKLARTKALRMTGNTAGSIEELKQLLAESTDDASKNNARYQLGLAYVAAKDWPSAITTFQTLTQSSGQAPGADKYWYELAWAQRENGDAGDAMVSFGSLATAFPNSDYAPEAHFLLGSQAYDEKDYPLAITQYELADVADARDEIREKARYKLGWAHFRSGNFDAAGSQFQKQVDDFKDGKLYADGLYMVAQCAYRANEFEKAFEAYTVAKPVIESSASVSPRIKILTLLNGAKSGIETKNYEQAASLATALIGLAGVDEATTWEAWLQLGLAQRGNGKDDAALAAFRMAAEANNEVGAQAQAMVGDGLFRLAVEAAKAGDAAESKSKFDDAIFAYKSVYYRYGGRTAMAEVKPWQAYAIFEAARCSTVQINDAAAADRAGLIADAIGQYETLVNNFPDNKLAAEAKKQLDKLRQLER